MSGQNYRMIANQAGDILKYDTTLNEIDRAAKSVFSFQLEEFPNEAITSSRAKKIHDWVLTLAKQKMDNASRSDLLKQFLALITPEERKQEIEELLSTSKVNTGINTQKKSMFSNRKFHSKINTYCQKLFLDGHYFHAVFEAAKIYHKLVQQKSQSEKNGQQLMLEVWNPDRGTLKVTACQSETDRNVQDGIGFLSAGLMRAIRNPTAHEPAHEWPISEQDCLDILGFISFLMRKLDESVHYGGKS